MKLEVTRMGNGLGLILPDELLATLDLREGGWVQVSETSDGAIQVAACAGCPDEVTGTVDGIMDEYTETVRALAG